MSCLDTYKAGHQGTDGSRAKNFRYAKCLFVSTLRSKLSEFDNVWTSRTLDVLLPAAYSKELGKICCISGDSLDFSSRRPWETASP